MLLLFFPQSAQENFIRGYKTVRLQVVLNFEARDMLMKMPQNDCSNAILFCCYHYLPQTQTPT